jgi:hypothetical protein
MMTKISVKEAVAKALQFLADTYGSGAVVGPRIEEVVLSEDESLWYLTLSFLTPPPQSAADFSGALGETQGRMYKVFEIDRNTGFVRSMKIRQLT